MDACYGSLTDSPARVRVDCRFTSAQRQTAHTYDFQNLTNPIPLLENFTGQQAQMEENETRVGEYIYTCTCSEMRGDRNNGTDRPSAYPDHGLFEKSHDTST